MKKQILGISGSLRKDSYNRQILNYYKNLQHQNVKIIPYSINDVPLFNADLEEGGDPLPVAQFKQAVKETDGLLIVAPEYSHGIPGVLKNVLDWAGSMTHENVLHHKPVMVLGASPGSLGAGFSQQQVRQTLTACNAFVMPQPQIYISQVHQKLDSAGRLNDEKTKHVLDKGLDAFTEWITFMS